MTGDLNLFPTYSSLHRLAVVFGTSVKATIHMIDIKSIYQTMGVPPTQYLLHKIRLDSQSVVCDQMGNSEKAKPTARWRRNATDLLLPRQPGCLSWVSSSFCYQFDPVCRCSLHMFIFEGLVYLSRQLWPGAHLQFRLGLQR